MEHKRNRFLYGIIIIIVIILGLYSQKIDGNIPYFIKDYLGDSLWSLMIFIGFTFIFNRMKTIKITIMALIFSFIIEISQLYHADWIDGIRITVLGRLVLGSTFSWSDLVAYIIGIIFGLIIDEMIILKRIDKG